MNRSPQDTFDQVAELTELYLLDEIGDDQLAELEALVRGDEQAADAMRTVLKQAGTMRVVFSEQRQFASRIGETNRDEYLALLQTLQPTEEPELVHIVGQIKTTRPLWQQWQFVIPSAIAALLAIAVTLIVAMSDQGPDPSTPNIAQTPEGPARATTPVATLTAQHEAQWAEGALAPGSDLHAGDRLTLTAGFAEITTNRGAIAILEAPATIELLDHNNAIRLHAGKLVGICETESSKGFLVRTPHMDITDLGTRFGVDVSKDLETEVHVMQGSVEVSNQARHSDPTAAHQLFAGQAIRSAGDEGVLTVAFDPDPFIFSPISDSLRPSMSGSAAVWLGQATSDLALDAQQSDLLEVYLERTGVLLHEDVKVDLVDGESWPPKQGIGAHRISAGQRVDVYLINLAPNGKQEIIGQYAMDFGRPIVGVIGADQTLLATDQQLGVAGMKYYKQGTKPKTVNERGLDTGRFLDQAWITKGATTLNLNLNATNIDQIRVLVQSR